MITVNGIEVKPTIFPDGTSQVWKLPNEAFISSVVVIWKFENEAEFMHLAQLSTLLISKHCQFTLYMPYLPYARQDKGITNETTFAFHTFRELLNCLHFNTITVYDAHNPNQVFDCGFRSNWTNISPKEDIDKVIELVKPDSLVFPDKGAFNKYHQEFEMPFIYGLKTRDQLTGEITGYKLMGNPKDESVLIVDDLADGGATFVNLAAKLKERGCKEINMFVSHGLFTKGTKILFDAGISRIFTKDGEVKNEHS